MSSSQSSAPEALEPQAFEAQAAEPRSGLPAGAPISGEPPVEVTLEAPDQASPPPVEDPDPVLDDVSAAAVDLARAAAVEETSAELVGAHLGAVAERGGLTLHTFACLAAGYRGWAWAVSLARPQGQPEPTVCEVVLLPQAEAVLAPTWVPWSDRLAPGDLGAGDELPYRADDPNLVPGYQATDVDDEDEQLFWELGLGRARVLGPEGAPEAARRWHAGPGGPESEVAVHAAAACRSCGYFLPVSGLLRRDFGVCANEWSPSDGTVVTVDHGCGAHSETDLTVQAPEPLPPVILDETLLESVDLAAVPAEPEPEPEVEAAVEAAAEAVESLEAVESPEMVESPEPVGSLEVAEPGAEEPEGAR